MGSKTASLVVVGDEILRGQVVDTNTSYLAKKLRARGINLQRVTVVPDIVDEIAQIVRENSKKYSIVFTSGGVGPTHDDVTYEAVAKALDLSLEKHSELIDFIKRMFPGVQEAERLAVVPTPCELIYVNAARKYAIVKAKNVYVLPGSPKYFEPAANEVVCALEGEAPLHFDYVDINTSEFEIVKMLDERAERWKNKVRIGSYPQAESFTRITLEGNEEDVSNAKDELFYLLPVQKFRSLKNGFSVSHARAVLEYSEQNDHVRSALDVLLECNKRFKPDEIFISFNGGKDCTVVLHLAATVAKLHNIAPFLCLYVTGEPFPEVDDFVENAAQFYGLELVKKKGPLKSALKLLLNERKSLKASLLGMRIGDPGTKNIEAFTPTDPTWPSLIRVNPILSWTYTQVWQFLLKNNVPYCPLYDKGYTSIGTKTTTMPNPLLKDPNNPSVYFPAYTLTDVSAERQGRH